MKAENLFGQISYTKKPFNCGYYVSTTKETTYFAEGEEKERDTYLKEHFIFNEETPNWESLHEKYKDDFYYSEWFVEDNMDEGYDKEGNLYEFEPLNKIWRRTFHLEDYEIVGGDGVTNELWEHKNTKKLIEIPIEIVRDYANIIYKD